MASSSDRGETKMLMLTSAFFSYSWHFLICQQCFELRKINRQLMSSHLSQDTVGVPLMWACAHVCMCVSLDAKPSLVV